MEKNTVIRTMPRSCGRLARLITITVCVWLLSFAAGCTPAENNQSATPAMPAEVAVEMTVAAPDACAEVAGIRPVCGFTNPEDMVAVPGGEYLLVSEMGAFMSDDPGSLSLLNLATEQRQPITINWDTPAESWGDPACAAPSAEKFSPHGIDLITRTDGRQQLLVVNHGNEQVDFFELDNPDNQWQLTWQGCATPDADPFMNDVAGLQDGGFLVTHMWNKSMPFEEVVERLNAGEKIGWVWEWQADSGFTRLPESVDLMPNGIAVSADNSKIFVNVYMANKTIKIDRASGKVEGEFSVRSPDNIVVDADGSLWVASHLNDPIDGRCEDGHAGACLLPFQVVKADPVSMQAEVVFTHDGAPMGYATVALPHNGRLYMGSASGDRVASIILP